MDRTVWVTRFIRRMEMLDVNLRPGQLAEMAASMFEAHGEREPEAVAEEAGQGGVRRND